MKRLFKRQFENNKIVKYLNEVLMISYIFLLTKHILMTIIILNIKKVEKER